VLARFIATFGYAGLLKPAPGTWGTLAGLPFGWLILHQSGSFFLLMATAVLFFGGWFAAHHYMSATDKMDDPSEVVVDEVVGLWIALAAIPDLTWLWVALAFALFRLFDIWKPGPIRWADRTIKGALGTMVDDVLAGVAAALCILVLNAAIGG